jgi:cation diffusion facilitator CzcD-associated flavoprotein CzcO
MLQRSPTYVVSLPGEDPLAKWLRRHLPDRIVYPLVRWKNVLIQLASYRFARKQPRLMKRLIRRGLVQALPEGYDVDTHFKPSYDPWDQRLCLVPDSDLFEAISSGTADVVTDRIKTFNTGGIELESGRSLEADVVVTATGLNLLFLGGMRITVDGAEPDVARALTYKGMMLSGVPNFAFTIGYTNASWTLKADLTSEYVCRLINHLNSSGREIAVPEITDPSVGEEPLLDFSSGYVQRSLAELPKQGSKEPWKLKQNYPLDLRMLRHGSIDDGTLRFKPRARERRRQEAANA